MKACLRCGYEGPDVKTTIVEYSDPVDVVVSVAMDANLRSFEQRTVPGRFGTEWRCTDRRGCDQRLAALEPVAVPVAPATPSEEASTWFD